MIQPWSKPISWWHVKSSRLNITDFTNVSASLLPSDHPEIPHPNHSNGRNIPGNLSSYGGFLSHRGTPSFHPFLDGIIPFTKTIHFWGIPQPDGNLHMKPWLLNQNHCWRISSQWKPEELGHEPSSLSANPRPRQDESPTCVMFFDTVHKPIHKRYVRQVIIDFTHFANSIMNLREKSHEIHWLCLV